MSTDKLKKTISLCLLISGIALSIVLLLGYFGKYSRFYDVLSNFKEQIFLFALCLLLTTLFFKKLKKINCAVLGVILIITLIELLPWYYSSDDNIKGLKSFRVSLINVLKKNKNYDDVLTFVNEIAPDVIVFMEIDDKWLIKLGSLDKTYQYKIISSKLGSDGIVIYSKFPIISHEEMVLSLKKRPNLKITLQIYGKKIDCLVAHPVSPTRKSGKWEDRNEHIANLGKLTNSAENPVFVVADLNTGMWSPFYKKFISDTKLRNTRQGFGINATYPAPLALISGVPIDHILIDENFICKNFSTGSYIGSDHLPIWADIGLDIE